MYAKSLQSSLTPCDPMDGSPPDSSVHGILQARIIEWVAVPSSRGSSRPRDWTHVRCLHWQAGFLPLAPPGKPQGFLQLKLKLKSLSCVRLCDTMDCSLPGSSIHGIFQARVLQWVAIYFSRESSWPRDWTWFSHIAERRFTIWATREAYYVYLNFLEKLTAITCDEVIVYFIRMETVSG